MPGGVEGDPGVHRCVVGQRARLADRGDADVDALERVRWKRDDDASAFVVHAGASVVVVVVFTPRSRRFVHSCVVFVVLGGGGERREDGVGAPAPAVFGAEHATRDEDDVGVVRYEQEPQEDQLVVQIALRAVGSRAAVRGDERRKAKGARVERGWGRDDRPRRPRWCAHRGRTPRRRTVWRRT